MNERPLKGGRPLVLYALIVVNSVMYFVTSFNNYFTGISREYSEALALVPALLLEPHQWYRLLTSMFIHADILHILFNMWFLYIFGRDVEKRLGAVRFLLLYLLSGIAAAAFHVGFMPVTGSIGLVLPALGASGAISGVLGAYAMLYPHRRLAGCYFMFFVPICFTTRAAWFLLFWFATQVIYGFMRNLGGVAFFAHAGGFIAGIALTSLLATPRRLQHFLLTPLAHLWHEVRGLGTMAKSILTALLAVVLAGAFYSSFAAQELYGIYTYSMEVIDDLGRRLQAQALFLPPEQLLLPQDPEPRIVLNRLWWGGLLYPGPPGRVIPIDLTKHVSSRGACREELRVYVHVLGSASYDNRGVLRQFSGTITTDVININTWMGLVISCAIGARVTYEVTMVGNDAAPFIGERLVLPMAAVAAIITAYSFYVVWRKSDELVAEGNETSHSPLPYPYV